MTRLSVVIPTYNRKVSLIRTLAALARQTMPVDEFEAVVISDGATDGTIDAVRDLSLPYHFRILEQHNQGPSVARNHGARIASAPLLVYVDDDIEPVPAFLEEHCSGHEGVDNLVMIGPQSGPMKEPMSHWIAWEHRMLQRQYANFVTGVWKAGPNNLYSGNFSVHRQHLLDVGGFNEKFTRQEDVELGFRLAQHGLVFRFNPKADGIHRPTRTFASWYKTPFEYGKRDVQMAHEGGEAQVMELARRHFRERNRLTRALARLCIGKPILEPMVLTVGRAGAQWGGRPIALAACSILFNLRYLQGMCCELGGSRQLWRILGTGHP